MTCEDIKHQLNNMIMCANATKECEENLLFVFQSNHFHNKLSEILDFVSNTCVKEAPVQGNSADPDASFGMQFPDLFVY